MKSTNKIPVSIHLLNKSLFNATSFNEIIKELIERVNSEKEHLVKVNLSKSDFDNHLISLFYSVNNYPPKWRGFFEPILSKNSPLSKAINVNHSFVCFVGFKENIFAITGGFGAQKVSHLMYPDFGLEILVRLFDKNSKVIKNIQDRGLTGNILGQTKFFRGDQRFSDENQFGKIFKQVQADLNKELLKRIFGFSEAELNRGKSGCMAKDSFQINKAVNFETMLGLVSKLSDLLEQKPKFSLNKVEHLSNRKLQNLKIIEELEFFAINELYNTCKKGESPNVDFCHSKFDDFLNADSVQIIIERGKSIEVPRHSNFGDIINLLKRNGDYFDDDETMFKVSVLDRRVISYNSEGVKLTSGTIFEHIHGEFSYQNKAYFLIDKEWYTIKPSFIRDINEECLEILKYALDDSLLKERYFLKEREGVYNQKYLKKNNYFVFDTITTKNIELCDIMKFDEREIHLIHVKRGFDNSIRDLTSQILISARLIQQDLRTGLEFIDLLEKQTKKSKNGILSQQDFPKNGLTSLFKGKSPKDIVFCFAFVDSRPSQRSIKLQINSFGSNIAKFSLIELRNELFAMGFGFKVIQIKGM